MIKPCVLCGSTTDLEVYKHVAYPSQPVVLCSGCYGKTERDFIGRHYEKKGATFYPVGLQHAVNLDRTYEGTYTNEFGEEIKCKIHKECRIYINSDPDFYENEGRNYLIQKYSFQVDYKDYYFWTSRPFHEEVKIILESMGVDYEVWDSYQIARWFEQFDFRAMDPIEVVAGYARYAIVRKVNPRIFILRKWPRPDCRDINEEIKVKAFGASWREDNQEAAIKIMIQRLNNYNKIITTNKQWSL